MRDSSQVLFALPAAEEGLGRGPPGGAGAGRGCVVVGQAAGAEVGPALLTLALASVLARQDLGHRVTQWTVPHEVFPPQRLSRLWVTQQRSTLNSIQVNVHFTLLSLINPPQGGSSF